MKKQCNKIIKIYKKINSKIKFILFLYILHKLKLDIILLNIIFVILL
jgi:hypothetical protein